MRTVALLWTRPTKEATNAETIVEKLWYLTVVLFGDTNVETKKIKIYLQNTRKKLNVLCRNIEHLPIEKKRLFSLFFISRPSIVKIQR